jgi:hypothetical protein
MKVVDIQLYRNSRAVRQLEQRIGELAVRPEIGSASKLKTCFREWLQKTGTHHV